MSRKVPAHVVSLVFYCDKCKSSNLVVNPDKCLEWQSSQAVEDGGSKGEFTMIVVCPSCEKDVTVKLKKWDTTEES